MGTHKGTSRRSGRAQGRFRVCWEKEKKKKTEKVTAYLGTKRGKMRVAGQSRERPPPLVWENRSFKRHSSAKIGQKNGTSNARGGRQKQKAVPENNTFKLEKDREAGRGE